jgi:hypothetical protein
MKQFVANIKRNSACENGNNRWRSGLDEKIERHSRREQGLRNECYVLLCKFMTLQ